MDDLGNYRYTGYISILHNTMEPVTDYDFETYLIHLDTTEMFQNYISDTFFPSKEDYDEYPTTEAVTAKDIVYQGYPTLYNK